MIKRTDRVHASDHVVEVNTGRSTIGDSVQGALERASQAWNLSRRAMWSIICAPALVAASGLVVALFGKNAYKLYTEEDGIAESLQVILYAGACIMAVVVSRYHIQAKRFLIAVLYAILACGLVFLIGEEVSWGQRIFGWVTPESMTAINKQDETNLHNIHGVGTTFKWVQMLVGAYGTILPLVFHNRRRLARIRMLIVAVVPHWTLIPCFLPMFAWKAYRNFAGEPTRYYYVITNYNEVVELILALGFFLFLVFQLRSCRREHREHDAV